jgi:TMEM175 potassium channel family protein
MESFSDGVIAVAITLLILNISVPDPAGTPNLAHALGRRWPQYAAYVTSFITIGIIWINHHAMVNRLREVNHTILFLNLLLLMSIVLLPFATNLMAVYLKQSQGQHLAAAVYGGSLLLMGVTFASLNTYTLARHPHMLSESLTPEHRRRLMARSIGGITPYVLATALAPVSAVATLVICAAVAAFYALPFASSGD